MNLEPILFFQSQIETILKSNNLDENFKADEFFAVRLTQPGISYRLCIERLGGRRVSVAFYTVINGDLVANPDLVFMDDGFGVWHPIELQAPNRYVSKFPDLDTIIENFREIVTPTVRYANAQLEVLWCDPSEKIKVEILE